MFERKEAEPGLPLPGPLPKFLEPPEGDPWVVVRSYFDPQQWNGEAINGLPIPDEDPVEAVHSRREGQGNVALFLSDMHMSDGTAGGDDFLSRHLQHDDRMDLYTGTFPPGSSRAGLFASVVTFALERARQVKGETARLDLVLTGDVIDYLAVKGRGGTLISDAHRPFFRVLAMCQDPGPRPTDSAPRRDRGGTAGVGVTVYWLRGNHDYVVPAGPWKPGTSYLNSQLRVLAEHGDFWDKSNWPPGPYNPGSRQMLEAGSAFEVQSYVADDGSIRYLMAGLDNLRPWSDEAIQAFFERRARYSKAAWLSAWLSEMKSFGAADDSAAYKGALERRQGPQRDWLMVQGHTHVPAAVPGVYYNLGTWISTLVAPRGKEKQLEVFPFLMVYLDGAGQRVEEYYLAREPEEGGRPRVVLQTEDSINALRKELGYNKSGA